MESFLAGLGSKLFEKWLTVLLLPGVLFVGAVLVAWSLPQTNAFDAHGLVTTATRWSQELRSSGAATVPLLVAAAMLCSAAAALTARGAGLLVQRLWLGLWHGPLARRLIDARRARWTEADDALADYLADHPAETSPGPVRDDLAYKRNRIALAYPARPTWIGDRAHSVDVRVWHAHGLDLASTWSRLWLLIPETSRTAIMDARAAFEGAATFAGWGLLYVILGVAWWPSAVGGLAVLFAGWRRARAAIASYADLVEAAADLNAASLARALGLLEQGEVFTRDIGLKVAGFVRKGT